LLSGLKRKIQQMLKNGEIEFERNEDDILFDETIEYQGEI